MAIKPIKVTFSFDGTGVIYDPNNPTHLDGLLAWALAPMHCDTSVPPDRDQEPVEIPLPLGRWKCHEPEAWGWCASALAPIGVVAESVFYRRRKMQRDRIELIGGTVNGEIGTMREWNVPVPVTLCHSLVGYALGNRKRVDQLLRKNIRYVGRERARGYGRVLSIDVEWCDEDWSMVRDGMAMRYLPMNDGVRFVRPRAPYWNNTGRVNHCDVGQDAPAWAVGFTK